MSTAVVSRLVMPLSRRDHARGPATAPVTLVEYGDYECPYCGMSYPLVEEARREMGKRLRLVYRHFPLTQIHPHAELAAQAAEAAGAQEKFWEMHATLYAHQDALDDRHLLLYAAALGLDTERFQRDLAMHSYAERVREDFLGCVRSGVNGTPNFFINSQRYDGPMDALLVTLERVAEEVGEMPGRR